MKSTFIKHLTSLGMFMVAAWWIGSASGAVTCGTGWFGSECQYKCHCVNNKACDSDKGCSSDCESKWFGPACQYVDLVQSNSTTQTPTWLSNDCSAGGGSQTVSVTMDDIFYFTWLRLRVGRTGISTSYNVQFSKYANETYTTCSEMKSASVNDTVLDIYCDPGVEFKQLTLTGEGVSFLCSLYISGGRNVALKQPTTQSYTLYSAGHERAVDGNRDNDYFHNSCTHTAYATPSSWTLTFVNLRLVSRYVIYNRNNNQERLKNFVLETYQKNGSLVFSYKDTKGKNQDIFFVTSDKPDVGISRVKISVNNFLTLCEVEMFGDTVCEARTYGRECENSCHCDRGTDCFVSSGGCPSGCAPGYQGDDCQIPCNATYYGKNCTEICSTNCKNQICDAISGTCQSCIPGKQGQKCDQACDPKYYGQDCAKNCSMNCIDQLCEARNGTCLSCIPGKQGLFCDQACNATYYGINCTQKCSTGCLQGTCDSTYGTCRPCIPGKQGSKCDKDCNATYFGKNCTEKCNLQCKDQLCDTISGDCKSCGPGKTGQKCDQDDENSALPVGAIVGAIVGFVVLVLLIVIGVILWRRYRHKKKIPGHVSENRLNAMMDIKHGTREETSKPMTVKQEKSVQAKPDLNQAHKDKQNSQKIYYNMVSGQSDTTIKVQDLNNFMTSHTKEFFQKQFANIPANSNATTTVALSPDNLIKNRYKNISAYDHSRVHLQINSAKKQDDYINASYIKGFENEKKFIASQGPTQIILEDFIRMLWEQKTEVVVMLTNLVEHGKLKCKQYWPDDGQMDIGDITVRLTTTQVYADYTMRRLELSKKSEPVQILTHFHFTTWPDKDVPPTAWGLVDLEERMARITTDKPIVVHCSAGVGRTGTFIALHNVLEEIERTGSMDFFTTVQRLRHDRILMVQTYNQYEFLHKATQIALVCKGTMVTAYDIQRKIEMLEEIEMPEEISLSGQSKLEKEFKSVCLVCEDCDDGHCEADEEEQKEHTYYNSRTVTNKMKNRLHNVLPKEYYRPILTCASEDMGDYINAVFVPSLKRYDHQVLTQLPLPTTITDFWRLVIEYKVALILVFEKDLRAEDTTIGDYLHEDEYANTSSLSFDIKISSCQSHLNWELQRIVITTDANKNPDMTNVLAVDKEYSLTHISCKSTDLSSQDLLELVRQIWSLKPVGERRILYMCRNGATFSGLVCTLSLLLERMENEQQVSVPLVVGTVKAVRSQVIPTLDQYRLLYQVLQLFVETNSVYSNFGSIKPTDATEH